MKYSELFEDNGVNVVKSISVMNMNQEEMSNMNTNKLMKIGLSALISTSMLAGCTKKETSKTSEEQTSTVEEECLSATLKVWAPEEETGKGSWMEKEIKAFKKAHPKWDLTIETEAVAFADVKNKLAEDAENLPDVYLFDSNDLSSLIEANAIAELGGETLNTIENENSSTIVNTVTYDGAVYGVPYTSSDTWCMYYDKRVFGEDVVKNIDAMLKKGKVGFSLLDGKYISAFYFGAGMNSAVDFASENAMAVTDYLVDLKNSKNFVNSKEDPATLLKNGTVNAVFASTSDYASMEEALGKENIAVCAMPEYTLNGKEVQLKTTVSTKAAAVVPTSKSIKAAVAFAGFLGSAQSQLNHYDKWHVFPVNMSIETDDAAIKTQIDALQNTSIVLTSQNSDVSRFEKMGNDIASGVVKHTVVEQPTEENTTSS